MELSKRVAARLGEAQEVLSEIVGMAADSRLDWLERQLANIVSQLQAMQADEAAGLSITDFRFFGDEEFQEMLEDLEGEIRNLRGLIRTLREVGR